MTDYRANKDFICLFPSFVKVLSLNRFFIFLIVVFVLVCLHVLCCSSAPAATVGFSCAASLQPPTKDGQAEFPEVPPLPVHDPHDTTPLSPLSQSSSGYFSTSVSTATLSDVLQPSSSSSSLLAAETTIPSNLQQQSTDRNDVLTSSSQSVARTAAVPPPPAASPANHNSIVAENSFSKQRLINSGGGGGGGGGAGGEGFERLEILLDEEERSPNEVLPDWLKDGAYVTVGSNKAGTVRFVGQTQFAEGLWVGVELDTPVGKNTNQSLNLLLMRARRNLITCGQQ